MTIVRTARTLAAAMAATLFGAPSLIAENLPDPSMTGTFVLDVPTGDRAAFEVHGDASVRLTTESVAGRWEGSLTPMPDGETYLVELAAIPDNPPPEEGPVMIGFDLNDPVPSWESKDSRRLRDPKDMAMAFRFEAEGPAWILVGEGKDATSVRPTPIRHLFNEEAGVRFRTRKYFESRFVLDAPADSLDQQAVERRIAGTWSNFASEFSEAGLMLCTNHAGIFFGGVSGGGVKWSVAETNDARYVVLESLDPTGDIQQPFAVVLLADLRNEMLSLACSTDTVEHAFAVGFQPNCVAADNRFWHASDSVPAEWEERIAGFPAALDRERRAKESRRRMEEEERARLERERPRYEEVLSELRNRPESLLELRFPLQEPDPRNPEGQARLKDSPEKRAALAALKDPAVPFDEATLIAFVNGNPWETHWIFLESVFARNELGSQARIRLEPKVRTMLVSGDYWTAGTFYEHPNTPLELAKAIDGRTDVPVGVFPYINRRIQRESIAPNH